MNGQPDDKLTSAEAADLAGVTVKQWRESGPLADGRMTGRSYYWHRATVESWIRARQARDRKRPP